MRERAPAKVNLCLFLGPVREDGRHELVTVFESISLCDELELTVLESGADEVVCPGVPGENLAAATLAALRDAGWDAPPVRIAIDKRIPVAAGLGGGSADAAATLRLANALSPLPDGLAARVAAKLGADVPSQLSPGLWLGTGAGERVEAIAPLEEHAFVVVPQEFGLSTPEVYAEADRLELPRSSLDRVRHEVAAIGGRPAPELLVNELQPAAISLAPILAGTLELLRVHGAEPAMVCGSGPTVIGLFWGANAERRAAEVASDLTSAHVATPSPASVKMEEER